MRIAYLESLQGLVLKLQSIRQNKFWITFTQIYGELQVSSHGGGSYLLSIIDDYLRKVWIYILKNKSDASVKFKKWKTSVENQVGSKVKKLIIDNGLAYLSNEFNTFNQRGGMARHKMLREIPQQNSLVEVMNRTILKRVRCMLSNSGLQKSFWAKVAIIAVL